MLKAGIMICDGFVCMFVHMQQNITLYSILSVLFQTDFILFQSARYHFSPFCGEKNALPA